MGMSWFSDIFKPKPKGVQPHCVINAIYCAWTWGTFKQNAVRIAVTKIDANTDHSQAQALINNVWTPLTEEWTGDHMEIVPWTPHYPGEPYQYFTLVEWIKKNFMFTTQES
jgi:hypothetical protein